jgi:hypothetical protein
MAKRSEQRGINSWPVPAKEVISLTSEPLEIDDQFIPDECQQEDEYVD